MKHYDVKYDINGNLPEYLIYKKIVHINNSYAVQWYHMGFHSQ